MSVRSVTRHEHHGDSRASKGARQPAHSTSYPVSGIASGSKRLILARFTSSGLSSALHPGLQPDPHLLGLTAPAEADEEALLELVDHLQAAEVDLLPLPCEHLGRELLHARDEALAIEEVGELRGDAQPDRLVVQDHGL